jgi:hypothetical protein
MRRKLKYFIAIKNINSSKMENCIKCGVGYHPDNKLQIIIIQNGLETLVRCVCVKCKPAPDSERIVWFTRQEKWYLNFT